MADSNSKIIERNELLDEVISSLELGCGECSSKCCSTSDRYILIDPLVEDSIPNELKQEKSEGLMMKWDENGCAAHDKETGRCSIYDTRPTYCAMFPFQPAPFIKNDLHNLLETPLEDKLGFYIILQSCAKKNHEPSEKLAQNFERVFNYAANNPEFIKPFEKFLLKNKDFLVGYIRHLNIVKDAGQIVYSSQLTEGVNKGVLPFQIKKCK